MLRQFKGHTAQKRKHNRFGKRLVAGVLVLLLILITMPSVIAVGEDTAIPALDIPETLTAEQLALHGAVERLRGEEDEYTFVFLNEDGTRTSYTYGVPVKFEQNGEYIDKNNTIKDFNNEYGNTASDVEIRFPKHLNKIKIKYNNHNIKISPVTSVSPGHINASVSGNTVTYYGAFGAGMDLRYASTMSGIKEDIILQSYQGVNSFSFEIETGGLEVKEQNGQYVIADGDEVIFSFGDLEVLDSFTGQNEQTDNWDEHRTNASGSVETVKANQRYVFTVTVDEDFLTNENTVYPVYIDPSFNVTSTYIEDTYICEGSPNTGYSTNARMKIGYGSSSQRNRILIQFSNFVNGESRPGLNGGTINSAILHMNCITTYSSQAYIDAYMIPLTANAWSVSSASWNSQYSNTSSEANLNGSTIVNGSGWFSFDITDAYRTWWQTFQNRGLMLRMRNEGSSPNYYREFASANNSDSTKLPYLAVHYGAETSGIQFSTSEYYMEIGQTRQLVPLTDLGQNDLAWSSDATSVATVSASGVVTAKAPGIAAITVSSKYEPNKQATCYITVVQVPTTGVTVNRTTEYIALGSQLTASATVTPSNATVQEVTWSTSNSSVAVVTQNGVVMTVGTGTATITARSKFNLRVYDSFQVNVYSTAVTGVTLNHTTAYVAKGKQLTVTATVAPSNATFNGVTWQSNNTSVATVSDSGTITAVSPGTATITVSTAHGNKTDTMTVIVPAFEDGVYYLQNSSTSMYADIEGPSNDSGATIHQWLLHGYASQQWEFTLLTDGYYKIKSMHSNLYLSVENNSNAENAYIIQSEYTGASGQQWKLQQLSDDRFKLSAKSGEANNRVLALPNYTSDTVPTGIPMIQRTYINDVDYIDEWDISPYIANYTIKMYYDRAFSIRYGDGTDNSAKTILEGFEERVAEVFKQEFRVRITFLEPEYYSSLPERCIINQGYTLNSTTINHKCIEAPGEDGECPLSEDCTGRRNLFDEFMEYHPSGSGLINILFTGHSLYGMVESEENGSVVGVVNRSFAIIDSFGNYKGICIQNLVDPNGSYVQQCMATLIHEISHQLGAPDHYHDGPIQYDSNGVVIPCSRNNICTDCCKTASVRPAYCLMYATSGNPTNMNTCDTEDIFCPDCEEDMMQYITG